MDAKPLFYSVIPVYLSRLVTFFAVFLFIASEWQQQVDPFNLTCTCEIRSDSP